MCEGLIAIETGTESYRLAHTKAQQQLKAVP